MPKNKIIIALGAVIALLPVLGFPNSWESVIEVILGLSIVALSVLITIDKKITLRAKAQRRQSKKVSIEVVQAPVISTEVELESAADVKWNKLNIINESTDKAQY